MDSQKRIVAVVFSAEDLLKKISSLKEQGYEEDDLHIVMQDPDRINSIKNHTALDIQSADSLKDKVKSFVTGEGSVRESIKSLNLSDDATERYTKNVADGGILLYVEEKQRGILDVIEEDSVNKADPILRDHEGHASPSRNNFVNSVDNRFDEQEDRFARGESFVADPLLIKDENHFSFTEHEKPAVQRARGGTDKAESRSVPDKKYK